MLWRYISDLGITWSAGNTFADPIQKACGEHHFCRVSQWKERLGECRKTLANQQQALETTDVVADRP